MIGRKHFSVISVTLAVVLLLMTMLSGCGRNNAASDPAASVVNNEPAVPAETAAPAEAEVVIGRQDGERFEDVIILEGMEETVRYEHVRNDTIGFEIDYDYENFKRQSGSGRERFVSSWDVPENPENYLDVQYSPLDADTAAASVSSVLSNDYEISREDSFLLERAGRCIRIDASADKGGLTMPEKLQMVYIIPAPDGCRIATAHYSIEGAEGFGRRFHYIMDSFSVLAGQGGKRISDEQAAAAIRRYCLIGNPDLESLVNAGESPVYWDISSSSENEIVVVFRSYTGALIRYYINPISGETYVTEFVPGITSEEQRTDESLNVWKYIF